jgi:signal transduction histidine kinase/ActR/RegA family two-component response regulator
MNLPALLSILGLICYSALLYVILSSPQAAKGKIRRRFFGSLSVMVAWQIAALVVSLARRVPVAIAGYQAMSVIICVFGVAYLLFIRAFLGLRSPRHWVLGGTLFCVVIVVLFFIAPQGIYESVYWNTTTDFYLPAFGPLVPLLVIPYFGMLIHAAILLLQRYRHVQRSITRNRIRYVLLGWCIIVLGAFANLVPSLKPYPLDLLANVINAALTAYAIFRYRLLDINIVVRQGLAYSLPTSIIAIGYFLIILIVEKLSRGVVGGQAFLISVLVAAITAVAAQPLRDRAQLWVDRLFFRDRYDAQRVLQELSELATATLDIEKVTEMLLDRLTTRMRIAQAGLMLRESGVVRFHLVAKKGYLDIDYPTTLGADDLIVHWLTNRKQPVTREDLEADPELYAAAVRQNQALETVQTQLFVPLIAHNTLIGILVLGPKRSKTPYSQDELLVLTTLANQVAIAIENARLYSEAQEEIAERTEAQLTLREREAALQRRTARLELLREVDEAILEARDLEEIVAMALQRTRELLGCDGAELVALDLGPQQIELTQPGTPRAQESTTESPTTSERCDPDDQALRRQLLAGDAYVAEDLHAIPAASLPDRQLRATGGRSAMLVPVRRLDDGKIETMILSSSQRRDFSAEEEEIGKDVAHSLALVIRHTQMRREIRERAEALEQQLARVRLFNEITRAIAARYDLDSILSVVAHRLQGDFADVATIWLEATEVSAPTESRTPHGPTKIEGDPLVRMVTSIATSRLQPIWRGETAYLEDLNRVDAPVFRHVVQNVAVRSVVVVPLVVDGTVLGFMVNARRAPDAFRSVERDFLNGLGEHVALAIHQTQLHEEVEAAYQELRETQRAVMQQERLRALGQMASGIAHDINNAITPIPLYLALIERNADLTGKTMGYLETIQVAVRDIEETVRRMRQFYRERDEGELLPVDVNQVVVQAMELTRPRWSDVPQGKGITIRLATRFQRDLPLVMGNEAEIRQAIINLILNAVDAMPTGGSLTLRTGERRGSQPEVFIEVTDTGVGMEEATQARAFEPFFSTKGARGSGLGLAIVYGTMQRHEGAVELDSAPGAGTTMRLILPIGDVVSHRAAAETTPSTRVLKVLCIEDEPLVREALQEVLASEGHLVDVAANGKVGLKAFRAAHRSDRPFDVVFTDLGMPDMDGRTVAKEIKKQAPQTPVIMLTGWGHRLHAEGDLPSGVDLVISKPPSVETLTEALVEVLAGEDTTRL